MAVTQWSHQPMSSAVRLWQGVTQRMTNDSPLNTLMTMTRGKTRRHGDRVLAQNMRPAYNHPLVTVHCQALHCTLGMLKTLCLQCLKHWWLGQQALLRVLHSWTDLLPVDVDWKCLEAQFNIPECKTCHSAVCEDLRTVLHSSLGLSGHCMLSQLQLWHFSRIILILCIILSCSACSDTNLVNF